MGTLLFVHGTGVRKESYGLMWDIIGSYFDCFLRFAQ
jgi:hypothetical protein